MNRKIKRKRWLDRRSKKINCKRSRFVSYSRSPLQSHAYVSNKTTRSGQRVDLTPPTIFSFLLNTEETMAFFELFAQRIRKQPQGTSFFIDSKGVKKVTVDALIYLIAILENNSINRFKRFSYAGNYPDNPEANRVYQESGFNAYVESKRKRLPKSNDKMQIIGNAKNESTLTKPFCDFVIRNLGKTRVDVIPLQSIFVELMSNVYHHAYSNETFMKKCWYMYAELIDDGIRFVFVDTGQGIARTVKKKLHERVGNALGIGSTDSKLIESAFNGDYRSQTNNPNRGNGLLRVKNMASNSLFDSFEVYSGHGKVCLQNGSNTDILHTEDFKNSIYGTLYTFIIK